MFGPLQDARMRGTTRLSTILICCKCMPDVWIGFVFYVGLSFSFYTAVFLNIFICSYCVYEKAQKESAALQQEATAVETELQRTEALMQEQERGLCDSQHYSHM